MPSTITHSYFMLDLYDKFSIKKRMFLKSEVLKMQLFAQSTDPFNFYMTLNLKKSKNIRNFAEYFHTHKTGDYLITLINYIKYNYYSNNPEVMAYLYGMISHYILDSNMHPFIYYNAGYYDKKDISTIKYNGNHDIFENLIDQFFIKNREKCYPYKSKTFLNIFQSHNYSKELKDVINFSFKETFGLDDYFTKWLKSVKNMSLCYKYLRYDRFNLKNKFYKLIDKTTPKNWFKLQFLSYHYTNKNINYLNANHDEWLIPTSKSIKQKTSFTDLYLKSIKDTLEIISEVDKYIYKDKKVNLKKIINNNSYKTGTSLKKSQVMKYFKN